MVKFHPAAVLTYITVLSCAGQPLRAPSEVPVEAVSLLGRKLYALSDDPLVVSARARLAATPKDAALALELSKAQAARRQYREAITTCTRALESAPENADLYLERGHRELGLRELQMAQTDLQRAVELSPKRLEAHYHLGLAHYFLRDFAGAAASFDQALALAKSSDDMIDCSNWAYVSHRRAGQAASAGRVLQLITPEVKNTEPHLYFYLRLLRFYQGALSEKQLMPAKPVGPSDIEGELSYNTINYGVGNWHLYNNNDSAHAREYFERVVQGSAWNSWGFIGSEIELLQGHPR